MTLYFVYGIIEGALTDEESFETVDEAYSFFRELVTQYRELKLDDYYIGISDGVDELAYTTR